MHDAVIQVQIDVSRKEYIIIAALGEEVSWIGAHLLVNHAAVKPARGPVLLCLLWN